MDLSKKQLDDFLFLVVEHLHARPDGSPSDRLDVEPTPKMRESLRQLTELIDPNSALSAADDSQFGVNTASA